MNQFTRLTDVQEEPARFTAEEFMAMATQDPLAAHQGRVDLVEGIIVRMAPPYYPHSSMQRQVFLKLNQLVERTSTLLTIFEAAVRLGDLDVRSPDIAVLGDPGSITGIIPASLLLLAVEIADSSLREDLGPKRVSYAEAGVPNYWVVDVNARQTHVFGDLADGDYQSRHRVPFGSPLAVPGVEGAITIEG